ncbi:MAG: RHS repeat protein [Bacteroidetes bacterium]|nr:RHS repeat protein [Bacteroidota bacterium]
MKINFPSSPLHFARTCALFFMTLFILQSCVKDNPYFPNPDPTPYRIKKITVNAAFGNPWDTLAYTFSYNKLGLPLTVMTSQVTTGNPNCYFKYDKLNRLIWFLRPYEAYAYETWDKYFYNDRNQIVLDSQYVFGTYYDSIPVGIPKYGGMVRWFKYDKQGRIIQRIDSTFRTITPYGEVTNFTYDASGNLVTGATYDNKVSYLRTNAVWMFLSNNFSVNNAFQADAYNSFGLPVKFNGHYPIGLVIQAGGQFVVEYERH